mgnify:CR=1 FL=1
MTTPNRGEIWMVNFDPSVGAEIQKTRPAAVINVAQVGRLPSVSLFLSLTGKQSMPRFLGLSLFQ